MRLIKTPVSLLKMKAYRRLCNYATTAVKQEIQYQIPKAARVEKNNPVSNCAFA